MILVKIMPIECKAVIKINDGHFEKFKIFIKNVKKFLLTA